jgi:enoyl-CoA hydratase
MGWLQGAIWSNRHVMEAVMAMKTKRAGEFPALQTLKRFADVGL